MRILFFLHNVSKTRHFDGVLASLAERGHSIVLAAARQRNRPLWLPKSLALLNDSLIERGRPGRIEITSCPVHRVDEWAGTAPALRRARDHMRFFDERYAHAAKLRRRSADETPPAWSAYIDAHPWRAVAKGLALAERVIPSDPLLDLFIKYERPDVVLVTPLVDYGSYQTDVVKSAHRRGVPVVFAPFSWDNLTNRGLIRVEPDRVLVWNDLQAREAIELHGVDPQRVVVTGAARFDEFFAMRPATTRQEFCRQQSLDPAPPLLLYLCSSEFVAPREVEFVQRWIASVRASDDAALSAASILVRPHPAHVKQWRDADLAGVSNAARWTEKETMNADQGLYDSLFHADAVIGLNTSAMIEAAILGKPVHTILAGEFTGGQEETLHFHYLRAAAGGLAYESTGLEEHVRLLAMTLRSENEARERCQRFVQRFVRPRGVDRPVAPVMVEEIEQAARISKRPRRQPLWSNAAGRLVRLALASTRALGGRRAEARA
jgi:hypothetical protein